MRTILSFIMAAVTFISARADKYAYTFHDVPVSEAIVMISKDHPEVSISFIYKELDKYRTSAEISTDDAYDALRKTIGLNPITLVKKNNSYYIEALQHGKYNCTGQAIGSDNEPVVAATVMLLAPNDSTVITYGITDDAGKFSIPCDIPVVIAKLTCLGYEPAFKRSEAFSVGTVKMKELPVKLRAVNVEAENTFLMSDKSIYRPTPRQKNAAQTATDLLARMAIPQLNVRLGSSSISSVSGEPVAVYIDNVPATEQELKMMKVSDVRSVEYLEYPSDPRFQGSKNVINFRMVKYEYGGYIKTLGVGNLIANSGLMQANARLVRKRMTYDVMGYGYYLSNDHFGTDQTETFRLPQPDGSIMSFRRETMTETSKLRRNNFETSFRALYTADRVTANSQVAFGIDDTPHNDLSGRVEYSGDRTERSDYSTVADSKAKFVSYRGYYYFGLTTNSSLTVSTNYTYSHTGQSSKYSETGIPSIANTARDNTHNGNIYLTFNRSFTEHHSLIAHVRGIYIHNLTDYGGSVNALDKSTTTDGQAGASYHFTDSKVNGAIGFGWDIISTRLNDNRTRSDFPYLDLSCNYVPNKRNSFGAVFHYSVWPPSSNYRSENIIHVSPYMWHTGNPTLKSHRSYDIGTHYTFVPSNRFSMTVFADAWLVGNRPAFVYMPTDEGIVRTIEQPIGHFGHYHCGVNATTSQLDGRFYLSGQIEQLYVHNGEPYNTNRSYLSYYAQALYYLGNFNFALTYQSVQASDNYDCMSGIWSKNKDSFRIQAGWSNSKWNINVAACNLQRWNWRATYDTMKSQHYSVDRWVNNATAHAFVQLSATYTFGFGKTVKQGNDISKQAGASSGILK